MKTYFPFIYVISILFFQNFPSLNFNANAPENTISKFSDYTITEKVKIKPKEFYAKHCAFCHTSDELIAPDIKKIKSIYLKKYPKKQEFISAMLNFIKSPSKEKAIYKEALGKFTLMPKMPFKEEELKEAIDYIYEKI